jgi:hypothetical protein
MILKIIFITSLLSEILNFLFLEGYHKIYIAISKFNDNISLEDKFLVYITLTSGAWYVILSCSIVLIFRIIRLFLVLEIGKQFWISRLLTLINIGLLVLYYLQNLS